MQKRHQAFLLHCHFQAVRLWFCHQAAECCLSVFRLHWHWTPETELFPMGPCCCCRHHAASVPKMAQMTSCVVFYWSWISPTESETYLPQATNHSGDLKWNKIHDLLPECCLEIKSRLIFVYHNSAEQEVNKQKLCKAGEQNKTKAHRPIKQMQQDKMYDIQTAARTLIRRSAVHTWQRCWTLNNLNYS